jgi:hypothetical protein
VGCAHSPEYSPSKVGAAAPPAIPSSERNALKGFGPGVRTPIGVVACAPKLGMPVILAPFLTNQKSPGGVRSFPISLPFCGASPDVFFQSIRVVICGNDQSGGCGGRQIGDGPDEFVIGEAIRITGDSISEYVALACARRHAAWLAPP